MDRQVPHFREELEALQGRLLEMGGLAEERVRAALQGLVSRDDALINKVLSGDEPINQLHIEVVPLRKGKIFKMKGEIRCDGQVVSSAELLAGLVPRDKVT